METVINITKEETLKTLVFLEWLKSYVMLWELKDEKAPFPKGTNKYQLDELINKYKDVSK